MVVELACTCDGLPSHSHTYEERPDDLACCGGLEGVGHVPGCPVLDYVTSELRRRAISDAADRYLANPNIAEIVRLAMLHRAREGLGRPRLRSIQ